MRSNQQVREKLDEVQNLLCDTNTSQEHRNVLENVEKTLLWVLESNDDKIISECQVVHGDQIDWNVKYTILNNTFLFGIRDNVFQLFDSNVDPIVYFYPDQAKKFINPREIAILGKIEDGQMKIFMGNNYFIFKFNGHEVKVYTKNNKLYKQQIC